MSNEAKPSCLNLRCKEMFYKDVSAPPTEHDLVVEKLYGKWDTRTYWCQCTQGQRGPDDQPVNRAECSRLDRPCFKGIGDLT
jgi:hypothetical protein